MPNRILRESILDSDAVNALTWEAEVFYRRLMSAVDDFGRFDGRPEVLRSRLYPVRSDRVREADIPRWLDECRLAGLISLYESGGKQYILFHKLGSPRAKASKFPEPPAEAKNKALFEGSQSSSAPNLESARICAQTRADVPSAGSYSGAHSGAGAPTHLLADARRPQEGEIQLLERAWFSACKLKTKLENGEVADMMAELLEAGIPAAKITSAIGTGPKKGREWPSEFRKRLMATVKAKPINDALKRQLERRKEREAMAKGIGELPA